MKQNIKIAVGGIMAALSLVFLFLFSVFPSATLAAPAVASILTVLAVLELNKKWAVGVFAAVSILSVLIIPSKEAAILYVVFFGYYPILKSVLESKIHKKWLEMIIKTVMFCVIMFVSYALMIRFVGIEFDEIQKYGMAAVPALLGLGAVAFIGYDYCLTLFVSEYIRKWQKRFNKLFKLGN
ncbi:MAG: hypothetical protein IJB86_09420 [Clostridia bacterium]|nr:hypothetical protein [Clostridia bacterium]